MKIIVMLIVAVCLCLFVACDRSSEVVSPEGENTESLLLAQNQGDITEDALYDKLDNIAQELARMRAKIAKQLPKQKLRKEERLSDLPFAESFEHLFVGRGGRKLHATVDFADNSPVDNISSQLRVAVDPDDFSNGNDGMALVYYVGEKGKLLADLIDAETYQRELPYPLLLVNIEEELPEGSQALPMANSSAFFGNYYLSYYWIKIRIDKDPWAKDEFEIYERNPNSNTIVGGTTFIFDGRTHQDRAGRYRTFPDLNGKGTNTLHGYYLALAKFNGSSKIGWHAIEDDQNAGSVWFTSCYLGTSDKSVTIWREDHQTYNYNETLVIGCNWTPIDGDDIYNRGGMYGFTEQNFTETDPSHRFSHNIEMTLLKEQVN